MPSPLQLATSFLYFWDRWYWYIIRLLYNLITYSSYSFDYYVFFVVSQIIMPLMPTIKGLYPFKFTYNIVQVMLCSYMCIEAGVRAYMAGYSLLPCNAFNHTNPPIGFILYIFYLSKILDFLDTVFIILEKRWKQLSFLHVYHHASIFMVWVTQLRYVVKTIVFNIFFPILMPLLVL